MAGISASMVMELRKISGQGMMDCKSALAEANGDIKRAMEILRKKGLATLTKRAGRRTSEGIVVGKISDDGKEGVIVTLCCETDFVAKSDDFVRAAEKLAQYAFLCQEDLGIENVLKTEIDGKKFSDILTEIVSRTGERMQIGDFVRYKLDGPGLINIYIHFNKKVGAIVQIETNDQSVAASEPVKQAAADIAMHVTAVRPLALDRDSVDAEIVEQEKAIFSEQMKNKPANIIDKIIEGKMKKFYAENCLLDQPFVKDDSKTVAQVILEAGKQAEGKANVGRFARFGVG